MPELSADGPIPESTPEAAAPKYAGLPPSFGEYAGAIVSETADMAESALNVARYSDSGFGRFGRAVMAAGAAEAGAPLEDAGVTPDLAPTPSPSLSKEAAAAKYPDIAKAAPELFAGNMPEGVVDAIAEAKRNELEREGTLSRYEDKHSWAVNFPTRMALTMLDPVNAASLLVPGVGEETVLARLGTAAGARIKARLIAGATAGAAGMSLGIGTRYAFSQAEGGEYGLRQAFLDLASGVAFGALIHGGIGALRETGVLRPDAMMLAERQRAFEREAGTGPLAEPPPEATAEAAGEGVEGPSITPPAGTATPHEPLPAEIDAGYVKRFLDTVPDEDMAGSLERRAAKGITPELKSRQDVFDQLTHELEDIRNRPSTAPGMNDPERVKLQEGVTDTLDRQGGFAQPNADVSPRKSEKRVDLVLGPPASGKSSHAVAPLLREHGAILLDADEAKQLLPEFDGGLGSAATHVESAKISENLLARRALDRGDNIVQPLVGKNLTKIGNLIDSYKARGYSVNLHYVDLPIEKAMSRGITRYVETGRLLDPGYIASIDHFPRATFDALKTREDIDAYQAISTDHPFGQPASIIESSGTPQAYPGVGGRGFGPGAGGLPQAEIAAVANADAATSYEATRAALAQVMDGRPVDVTPIFDAQGRRTGSYPETPNSEPLAIAQQQLDLHRTGFQPSMSANELEAATEDLYGRPESAEPAADESGSRAGIPRDASPAVELDLRSRSGAGEAAGAAVEEGREPADAAGEPAQAQQGPGAVPAQAPAASAAGVPGEALAGRGAQEVKQYPRAGAEVDGLRVDPDVPNTSSISASLGDDYTELPGLREVPFSDFGGAGKPVRDAQTMRLANEIQENGFIKPLIVIQEENNLADGPWILEGGHRFDALQIAGKKSFPAMVIVDHSPREAVAGRGAEEVAPIPSEIPNGIGTFTPAELGVDPERFQFKAGGDEAGVTERLKGVTTWDPIKAGMVLAWVDKDGKPWIVDGHQRVALAKRIAEADPAQNPQLLARTLKETDGVTPSMARAVAAMKNIAEGTGTAVDAAKIIRDHPEMAGDLPPRSELVRQARGLVNLDPEAFRMVINDVVPPNYAAIVGRLVPADGKMQGALLSLLSKTDPANATQAEAIVRQGLAAGMHVEKQTSLFGDQDVAESLYLERAKVLDRALKQLRRDKAVFSTLVKESDLLEQAGNKLAKDINEKRATADAQALQILQILANRSGPISDALGAAARRAKGEGSYAGAIREFVGSVRKAASSGDLARLANGIERGAEHVGDEGAAGVLDRAAVGPVREAEEHAANAEVERIIHQPAVEPGAEGKPQLVLPGAEQSARQAAAAREAQGGLRGAAPQQEAGGLFAPKEAPELDLRSRSGAGEAAGAAVEEGREPADAAGEPAQAQQGPGAVPAQAPAASAAGVPGEALAGREEVKIEEQIQQAKKLGLSLADMGKNLADHETQMRDSLAKDEAELAKRQRHLAEEGGKDSIIEGYIRGLNKSIENSRADLARLAVTRAAFERRFAADAEQSAGQAASAPVAQVEAGGLFAPKEAPQPSLFGSYEVKTPDLDRNLAEAQKEAYAFALTPEDHAEIALADHELNLAGLTEAAYAQAAECLAGAV